MNTAGDKFFIILIVLIWLVTYGELYSGYCFSEDKSEDVEFSEDVELKELFKRCVSFYLFRLVMIVIMAIGSVFVTFLIIGCILVLWQPVEWLLNLLR